MSIRERIRGLRRRTWVITGALALVAVAGGAAYWFGVAVPASAADAEQAPVTATASLETMEKTVETSGTVSASVTESVAFEASGTVTAVNAAVGQAVAAGDVLATVDTLQMEADLLDARATLAQARATLADSEASNDGSSAGDARVAADVAAVAVAQAAVDDAEAAMDATTLVAPVAGVVTSVDLAVGDTVSATSSASTGTSTSGTAATAPTGTGTTGSTSSTTDTASTTATSAVTIVGTDSWTVDVTVGETEVALIAVDDQVELSLSDGTAFFGTVAEIGVLPSTDSGAAAYPVSVTVTGDADGLHDGVTADASIVYERRTEVLTVPTGAVTTSGDETSVTLVGDDGTETETAITVGDTSGSLVEVTAGLVEGDRVAVTVFSPAGSGGGGQGELPDGFPTDMQGGGGTTPPEGFEPPAGFPGTGG